MSEHLRQRSMVHQLDLSLKMDLRVIHLCLQRYIGLYVNGLHLPPYTPHGMCAYPTDGY